MTDEQYERFLSEFGERIEGVAESRASRRPRRRWPVAAGLALVLALAGALLLGGVGGTDKINVVAEAKAALSESKAGEIVHLVTVSTSTLIGADDAALRRFDEFAHRHWDEYRPQRFEQWSTEDRWRVATDQRTIGPKMFAGMPYYPGFYISDSELRRIGLANDVTGPTQESYADGIDSLYVQDAGAVVRAHLGGDDSRIASFPGGVFTGSPSLLGGDPVDAARDALASGDLRDAGPGEVDGRSVRRLLSGNTLEYDVDAETFAPVRVRMFGHWADELDSPHPLERMAEDVTFETYETLPLDANTEHLLELHPPDGTTVVDAQGPHEQPPRSER